MASIESASRTPTQESREFGSGARVAIVGAGLAGLACARELAERGLEVRVYEKARGPGGRLSTRRGAAGRFDHGAQYFTARDAAFASVAAGWLADGWVAPWQGRIVRLAEGRLEDAPGDAPRYVPVPRMSALARHLAVGLELQCGVRVGALQREGARVRVRDDAGGDLGHYDAAIVATPAAQAVPLLSGAPQLAARASSAALAPCLAVMVAFESDLALPFDAAFVEGSPLAWVARDSSKPGRAGGSRWVLHASAAWSAAHLEEEPATFCTELLAAFARAVARPLPEPRHLAGHRWRFARPIRPLDELCLFDAALGIGACGDWCGGDRVESAWRSGVALAGRLLGAETPRADGPPARDEARRLEESL